MIIPEAKKGSARRPQEDRRGRKQFNKGIITDGERYNKIIDIWTRR
jgi:DNA-directed RNA polymerase subunit beta'